MRYLSIVALGAVSWLAGCASTPLPQYFVLASDMPRQLATSSAPSVAITRLSLPELIDRPQLVFRTADHQMQVSEHLRWAEPLRRQIPLVLAEDLGQRLGSSRVAFMPVDAQGYDADFRVQVDIQRLEVKLGEIVLIDAIWRVEGRDGKAVTGRSTIRESIDGMQPADAVAAQRRALTQVAGDIAGRLRSGMPGKS